MITIKQRQAFKIMLEKLVSKDPITMGGILREAGYSKSTSETPSLVTTTKGWEALIAQINDIPLLERLYEIAVGDDKRACLQAIDQIMTLKDRKPKADNKVIGLFEKIDKDFKDERTDKTAEVNKLLSSRGTTGGTEVSE